MNGWPILACAILSEVTATLALKRALDHPPLYAVVAIGYVISFTLLIRTLRSGMGIGLTYGVWAGCGVGLTAIGSRVFFGESFNAQMVLGVVLVIAGVLCLELGAMH